MTIRDSLRALPPAVAPGTAAASPSQSRRAWRLPLAAKLAAALIGLVALVLMINGAINTWLNANQAKSAALEVQQEKARSAAVRVGEFLADIETQLGWTTGAEWRFAKPEQQRYDFIRLLRQVPAITELTYLDGQGREQIKVSRLEPDSIASGKDFSTDPRFTGAVADKVWFGPVEFRRGSEPYMTIALAHVGKNAGVTVADVNLKLIWDVISAIRVGEKGYAFVVDDKGRLIADPDLSLVLRDTDLSGLPQVKAALAALGADEAAGRGAAQPVVGSAKVAKSLGGGDVLTAYAIAPKPRWIVFVQQPLAEALAAVTRSIIQTLALLGLGLLLALLAGGLLARRMVVPIRRLQEGAERLGAGDLSERLDIRTGDEIETLADRFNQMAGRIQESYETLEAKVEARTKDLNEALQQQTATADVLKVISRSAFDLQAVFDTLIASAVELCDAHDGTICVREGDAFRFRASAGTRPDWEKVLAANPPKPGRGSVTARVLLTGQIQNVRDVLEDPEYVLPIYSANRSRSVLGVPLLRDDKVEGALLLARHEPGHFTDRQVELIQTFADQAVIAIENVRLFDEVQARTKDLSEALRRQTATSDILRAIAASPGDVQPVLDRLVETVCALCEASDAVIMLRDGEDLWTPAHHGPIPTPPNAGRRPLSRDWPPGRAVAEGRTIHVHDLAQAQDEYPLAVAISAGVAREAAQSAPGAALAWRTAVAAPLMREGEAIGAIVLRRVDVSPFSDAQVALLQTFADQAVIAVENARLFDEVRTKTRDIEEALAQQTATADVLKVISRSAFDVDSVLRTLTELARSLSGASMAAVFLRNGEIMQIRAEFGLSGGVSRVYGGPSPSAWKGHDDRPRRDDRRDLAHPGRVGGSRLRLRRGAEARRLSRGHRRPAPVCWPGGGRVRAYASRRWRIQSAPDPARSDLRRSGRDRD